MTQNVFGPPGQSIFQSTRYQGEYVTQNDLHEIVFSYSGRVATRRESGFWVPVRRSTIVQLVATMRVPAPVNITVTSGGGDIALFVFNPNVYVMTFPRLNTIPSGALGGFVRVIVDPGTNTTGEDLSIMLRYLEVS